MTDGTYTAIAVLMDRSGSMDEIRDDAQGALSAFIADQAKLPGRCTIRLSHFDNHYEDVYPSTPIGSAPAYALVPRGSTALLDGIGRLVVDFGAELAALPEDARPGTVIVIIQTDGYENASQEWTRQRVFDLITEQRTRYRWTSSSSAPIRTPFRWAVSSASAPGTPSPGTNPPTRSSVPERR